MTKYNNIQIYEEPIFACTDDKGNWELDEGGQVIKYYKIGGVDITIDFDKSQLRDINDIWKEVKCFFYLIG